MVLQKINITKKYLEALLGIGMQKRTMIDINNVKKVAQAIDYLIEVSRETFNSVTNNSSGVNISEKISPTAIKSEVVVIVGTDAILTSLTSFVVVINSTLKVPYVLYKCVLF